MSRYPNYAKADTHKKKNERQQEQRASKKKKTE